MKDLAEGLVATTVADLGIDVDRESLDEIWALCPQHKARTGQEDHKPSWSINSRTGLHSCFSCHYKGNLYTLVRDLRGTSDASLFLDALRDAGRYIPESWEVDTEIEPRRPDDSHGQFLNESVFALFTEVPFEVAAAKHLTTSALVAYGVLWNEKNASWVLPFRDPYSKALIGYQEKFTHERKFLNYPPHSKKSETLFGLHLAELFDESVVVVESPLDAVRAYSVGYSAVAVGGSHLSDRQLELLEQFDLVILALDDDEAGNREMDRLDRTVLGFRHVRADFHGYGKDFGEMTDAQITTVLQEVVR